MLPVEAAAAGVTSSPGRLHRDLGNYMSGALRYNPFPLLRMDLGEYIILLTFPDNLILVGSLLRSYCSVLIARWLSYS